MVARRTVLLFCAAALAVVAAGCGGGGGGAAITADGSSTVGPYVTAAAEGFRDESDAKITVGISGTGGGFDRFCAGETDISDASRPIKDEEAERCADAGIEYVEFTVANDALTNIVSAENDWATCLTVDELEKIWEPGSKVSSWKDVRDGFPDVALKLYGAGTDSGTFDYFTDAIVGAEGASRTDYAATEDDNVTVQGVAGSEGGLGYLGFSYFEENQTTLRALEVDGGSGCVAPSVEAAQDGSYTPLSRPLFAYVKTTSFAKPEVREFIGYMLDNEREIAEQARFIALNDEQLAESRSEFDAAVQASGS